LATNAFYGRREGRRESRQSRESGYLSVWAHVFFGVKNVEGIVLFFLIFSEVKALPSRRREGFFVGEGPLIYFFCYMVRDKPL